MLLFSFPLQISTTFNWTSLVVWDWCKSLKLKLPFHFLYSIDFVLSLHLVVIWFSSWNLYKLYLNFSGCLGSLSRSLLKWRFYSILNVMANLEEPQRRILMKVVRRLLCRQPDQSSMYYVHILISLNLILHWCSR